jgi:hypothetical protein
MKTVDVSGIGGGYEHACQKMIQAGVEYLKHHGVPDNDEQKESKSDRMQGLKSAIIKAADGDCTGAMYYTSLGHAIARVSDENKYWDLFKDEPDRIYEWDGTIESVPKTELSERMEKK